jgi:hypothetical protein
VVSHRRGAESWLSHRRWFHTGGELSHGSVALAPTGASPAHFGSLLAPREAGGRLGPPATNDQARHMHKRVSARSKSTGHGPIPLEDLGVGTA